MMDTENRQDVKRRKARSGKPNVFQGSAWLSVDCASLVSIFTDKAYTGVDYRVLGFIMGTIEYANAVMISQAEIGKRLGIARQQVSKSMRKFKAAGIIMMRADVGMVQFYELAASFAWRGSGRSHQAMITRQEQAAKLAAKEAREADNLARLRVARMRFMQAHPDVAAKRKYASSGYRGVSAYRSKFRAQIQRQSKKYTLGTFATALEASKAYEAAVQELSIHKAKG